MPRVKKNFPTLDLLSNRCNIKLVIGDERAFADDQRHRARIRS